MKYAYDRYSTGHTYPKSRGEMEKEQVKYKRFI